MTECLKEVVALMGIPMGDAMSCWKKIPRSKCLKIIFDICLGNIDIFPLEYSRAQSSMVEITLSEYPVVLS